MNFFDLFCSHSKEEVRHTKREALMADLDVQLDPNTIPVPEKTPPAGAIDKAVDDAIEDLHEKTLGPLESKIELVLETMEKEWVSNIKEPSRSGSPANSAARIDQYIRGAQGLNWSTAKVGTPGVSYTKNGQFAWCGAFAAHCFGAAGLNAVIRKKVMPSTYRLWEWGRKNNRIVDGLNNIQRGDIVIVAKKGAKPWGNHITTCLDVIKDFDDVPVEIQTFEGNAKGPNPDGKKHEGVIRHIRPYPSSDLKDRTYRVHFAIRFKAGDFDG